MTGGKRTALLSLRVFACEVQKKWVIELWYWSGKLCFLDTLEEIGSGLQLEKVLLKSVRLTWKADTCASLFS